MKIHGIEGMSPEDIRDETNRGGRLVVYTYCISALVVTLKRPTEVRLIRAGRNPAAASWPYTAVSLLLGWWGIPWGPIYTFETVYRNLCGGIDVTDGVLKAILPQGSMPVPAEPPSLTVRAAPQKTGRFNAKVAGAMIAGLASAVVLGISVHCWQRQRNLTVVLASGIDRSYSISLNNSVYTLPPHGSRTVQLPEGDFRLSDAGDGHVVGGEETFTFAIPLFDHLGRSNVALINPDRSAVFIDQEVPYYADGAAPSIESAPNYRFLANQLTYFLPKPDFVMVDPDQHASMPSGTSRLVKRRVGLFFEPSPSAVAAALLEKTDYDTVRGHFMHLARHQSDEDLLQAAVRYLKPDDALAFFNLRLAERPVLVEWHRYYQNTVETSFPERDLAAEYRSYMDADPKDGALAYLLGREVDDPVEQTALWRRALASDPPCGYAYGAMGFDAMSDAKFDDALAFYEASEKSGIRSRAITHYRREVLTALGRSADILHEIAAERKTDPLNIELAAQEIVTTYAASHDTAALKKLESSFVDAMQVAHWSEKIRTDAETYLKATIAYVTGNLAEYATLVSRFDSPFYRFRASFTSGKLDDAASVFAPDKPADPNALLLLYLLAHRSGNASAADRHFQAAVAAMKSADRSFRKVAALLGSPTPDSATLCSLRLPTETKRILLTALGTRFADDRPKYFDLARKINFNPEFPHQFLATVLSPDNSVE